MKCKHQKCNCRGEEVRADGFCSDSCRDGGTSVEKCSCGHSDCH